MEKGGKTEAAGVGNVLELFKYISQNIQFDFLKIAGVIFVFLTIIILLIELVSSGFKIGIFALGNYVVREPITIEQAIAFSKLIIATVFNMTLALGGCLFYILIICVYKLLDYLLFGLYWLFDKRITIYLAAKKKFLKNEKIANRKMIKYIVFWLMAILFLAIAGIVFAVKFKVKITIYVDAYISVGFLPLIGCMLMVNYNNIVRDFKTSGKPKIAYLNHFSAISSVADFIVLVKLLICITLLAVASTYFVFGGLEKPLNMAVGVSNGALAAATIIVQNGESPSQIRSKIANEEYKRVSKKIKSLANKNKIIRYSLMFIYKIVLFSVLFILAFRGVAMFVLFKRKRKSMLRAWVGALLGFLFGEFIYWSERFVFHRDDNTLSVIAFVAASVYFAGTLFKKDGFSYKSIVREL